MRLGFDHTIRPTVKIRFHYRLPVLMAEDAHFRALDTYLLRNLTTTKTQGTWIAAVTGRHVRTEGEFKPETRPFRSTSPTASRVRRLIPKDGSATHQRA